MKKEKVNSWSWLWIGVIVFLCWIFYFILIEMFANSEGDLPLQKTPPLTLPKLSDTKIKEDASIQQLHWSKLPITFYTETICGNYETPRIKRAFNKIANSTGNVLSFVQVNNSDSADIYISCSFLKDCYVLDVDIEHSGNYVITTKTETICAHSLGLAERYVEGNIITAAKIEFVGLDGFMETTGRAMSGFFVGTCGQLTTEIHEILHTMGYEHTDSGIMSPIAEFVRTYRVYDKNACVGANSDIDSWIIDELKEVYSKVNKSSSG